MRWRFLAESVVSRNLDSNGFVFGKFAQQIHVSFANLAVLSDASEVVDHNRSVGELLAHSVQLRQVVWIDQATHRLTGLGCGFPHLLHAICGQPLWLVFTRADSETCHAGLQHLFHQNYDVTFFVIDLSDDSKAVGVFLPGVNQVRIIKAVVRMVLNQDDSSHAFRLSDGQQFVICETSWSQNVYRLVITERLFRQISCPDVGMCINPRVFFDLHCGCPF